MRASLESSIGSSDRKPRFAGTQPVCQVTVIIIFLNEADFLAEAIESVRAQSFAYWELLLVDDGSTDGSSEIARRFATREPDRIRYLDHQSHTTHGMSASRNLGIAHAMGELLLFVDADDIIVPRTLEDQVTFMEAHPQVDTVYGPMCEWRSWDEGRGESDSTLDLHLELDRVHSPQTILSTFLLHEDAVPSGNLLRTEVVRKVGGFEEEFTGAYEDQVFRVKFCRIASAYVSSRVWYYYRKHPKSCCAQIISQGRMAAARQRFLHWVESYCRVRGMQDRMLWRVIKRALRPFRYPRVSEVQTRLERHIDRWKAGVSDGIKDLLRPFVPTVVWAYLRDRLR
ncbi:hypothetical protein YTPLAS18_19420 [Nitrospira sp.]|nr:hypothetical protein YTPLAS18_19420 [Nitrospira sp.]